MYTLAEISKINGKNQTINNCQKKVIFDRKTKVLRIKLDSLDKQMPFILEQQSKSEKRLKRTDDFFEERNEIIKKIKDIRENIYS